MEFNESTYNLFDDFLSGKLSEVENAELEKTLEEDENIREEFSFYKSAITTIRMLGNQILKKQLAAIGMGIPSGAFQKYSPSIKPKSFFRKYWVAVSVSAAVIIALTIWFVVHHQKHSESENSVLPVMMDSAKDFPQQNNSPTDSCVDSPTQNSFMNNAPQPKAPNDSIIDCFTYQMSVFPKNGYTTLGDEGKITNGIAASAYTVYKNGNKISVTFCKQDQKPPFYSFSDGINIFSSYSDSTNIRFYKMSADELMMRDDKPGYFILKRGSEKEEKLLVRVNASGYSHNDFKFGDDSIRGYRKNTGQSKSK